LQIKIVVDPR